MHEPFSTSYGFATSLDILERKKKDIIKIVLFFEKDASCYISKVSFLNRARGQFLELPPEGTY